MTDKKTLAEDIRNFLKSDEGLLMTGEDWETIVKALEQEPKTGHWIYKNDNWHCSECDETPKTLGYVGSANFMLEHFKFCNHCGYRMKEVSE